MRRSNDITDGEAPHLTGVPGPLALAAILFAISGGPLAMSVPGDEPEDSPLFENSVQKVFAKWESHDLAATKFEPEGRAVVLQAGAVIAIEGDRWYSVPAAASASGIGAQEKRGPSPLSVTTEPVTCAYSCSTYTCQYVSCMTPESCNNFTCSAPTCGGQISCFPGPSCLAQTCADYRTCDNYATCNGYPTCGTYATCGWPTCVGVMTCSGFPTCTPSDCRTTLSHLDLSQPGEIRMSFSTSSSLRYTLLCCTNLNTGLWTSVFSQGGNDQVVTVVHTNSCPSSYYRLLIDKP